MALAKDPVLEQRWAQLKAPWKVLLMATALGKQSEPLKAHQLVLELAPNSTWVTKWATP